MFTVFFNPSMFSQFRSRLLSHKSFVASVDEAIHNRSARLTELVDRIELHAEKKFTARKFSDIHEYLFLCARVYKMCTRSEEDRRRIRAAVLHATEYVPWSRLNDDQVARSLWSIATAGAQPKRLGTLNLEARKFDSNKSFANVIWSLARFAENQCDKNSKIAESLVANADDDRAKSFTNDELVSVLRALATIQNQ